MTERQKIILHIFFDFVAAMTVWFLFYAYRVTNVENAELVFKGSFYYSLVLIPLFWIFLYTIQGTYFSVLRNYRIKTIKQTLFGTFIGVIIVFFTVLLNDFVYSYTQYYALFFILFGLHFFITLIPRFIMTTIHVKRIHKGKFGFKTLIIGGSEKAVDILLDIQNLKQRSGHKFIGFVNINGDDFKLKEQLPHLGDVDDINQILDESSVEEVIIALESSDHERLKGIITNLAGHNIRINLIPDAYDLLSGQVQMNSIFGALLIKANPIVMPDWQFSSKRIIDVGVSLFAMILLLPFYIIVAILVKISSKGPVFFKQSRNGFNYEEFDCFKFRSMTPNKNSHLHQATREDQRITKVGKFLRKTSLDELPQFYNVLFGDMSIVGPRPHMVSHTNMYAKRVDKFMVRHFVKPGITGLAQISGFRGEVETDKDIIGRVKYDIFYIENWSLLLDVKIIFQTLLKTIKGDDKAY